MKKFIIKNYKYILLMVLFIILFSIMNVVLFADNCDQIWEFGFAHNILQGMIPYKDFNMVTLPMHSWINAVVLKVFGDKYIIYLLFHNFLLATIPTYTFFKSNSLVKALIVFLLLIPCSWASYNAMLLFNLFLLLYLENNTNKDYLVGIILAFSLLIKQSVGVFLILPTLFLRDRKRIRKRMISFFTIMLLFLLYLLFTGSFYDCMNYTVFGLFDFASDNGSGINFFVILSIIIFIVLIYKYKKTKNFNLLYLLSFSSIIIPLFDFTHFCLMIIPIIIVLIINDKIKLINNIYLSLFLFISIIFYSVFIYKTYVSNTYIEKDKNNIFYLSYIKTHKYDVMNKEINCLMNDNKDKKVYLLLDAAYLFHLDNNRKVDAFSLTLYGNNGYKGTKKLEDTFDKMDTDTIFIIDNSPNGQSNRQLREYVKKNSDKIGDIASIWEIYQKK